MTDNYKDYQFNKNLFNSISLTSPIINNNTLDLLQKEWIRSALFIMLRYNKDWKNTQYSSRVIKTTNRSGERYFGMLNKILLQHPNMRVILLYMFFSCNSSLSPHCFNHSNKILLLFKIILPKISYEQ